MPKKVASTDSSPYSATEDILKQYDTIREGYFTGDPEVINNIPFGDSLDSGVNDTIAYWFSPDKAKKLLDKASAVPAGRRTSPPVYDEYIEYTHRYSDTSLTLRIGDCQLIIPPDFISVKEISSTESQVALRQENSFKTKHGYSRKEITMTLYFNGIDQINGYEVESPFDYPYYVDGLRPLIAQFKCTPFLPVENECLNDVNNIYTIALQSLTVNTLQGFPDCLQVTIIAHEFNVVPYISMPNYCFDSCIDWDLFRFYYQQLMREDIQSERTLRKAKIVDKDDMTFYLLDAEQLTSNELDSELEITDKLFQKYVSKR
jgi:hypothetical protein